MQTVSNLVSKKAVVKKAVTKKEVVIQKTISASVTKKIKEVNTDNWIYVSPKDNLWTVRKDGAVRALHVYKLKSTALNAARRIAQPLANKRIIVYDRLGEISKIIP
jgi:Uncharacterized protein conserved in bacteria (DUF2188)